jgi:hypothetical protein
VQIVLADILTHPPKQLMHFRAAVFPVVLLMFVPAARAQAPDDCNARVVRLNHRDAREAVPVIRSELSAAGVAWRSGRVGIVGDSTRSSVFVLCVPDSATPRVDSALRAFDRRPATIAARVLSAWVDSNRLAAHRLAFRRDSTAAGTPRFVLLAANPRAIQRRFPGLPVGTPLDARDFLQTLVVHGFARLEYDHTQNYTSGHVTLTSVGQGSRVVDTRASGLEGIVARLAFTRLPDGRVHAQVRLDRKDETLAPGPTTRRGPAYAAEVDAVVTNEEPLVFFGRAAPAPTGAPDPTKEWITVVTARVIHPGDPERP